MHAGRVAALPAAGGDRPLVRDIVERLGLAVARAHTWQSQSTIFPALFRPERIFTTAAGRKVS